MLATLVASILITSVHGERIYAASPIGGDGARFITEAPKGWAEMQEFSWHTHGVISELRQRGGNAEDRSPKRRLLTFTFSGDSGLFGIKVSGEPSVPERTECVNDRYAFQVVRSADDSPWFVARLSNDVAERRNLIRRVGSDFVSTPWVLFDAPLPEVVADPAFVLRDVVATIASGREAVSVNFEYNASNRKYPRIGGGKLDLLPQHHWALASYRVQAFTPESPPVAGMLTAEIEYSQAANGFLLARRIDQNWAFDSGNTMRWLWEYTSHSDEVCAETDFTLSAFGLAEPGAPASRDGWLYAGTIVAIGLVLLSGALMWRRQAGARGV